VAIVLALRRTIRRQGPVLFAAVTGFGLATIVFGLSRSFWLTFAALAVTGLTDTISTVIRNTLRQLQTPDRLRGRMTSVSQLFFMGGPQLGEFEAGLVAQLFSPAVSVVTGGLGCLIATGWVARRYPQLLRYDGRVSPLATDLAPAAQASSD
jgi:MFS family permease